MLGSGRCARPATTLLVLLLLVVGLVGCGSATPAVGSDAATAQQLDQTITGVMREAGIPGAIVGVWRPGHADYAKAFGVADKATGAPMTTDLYMRIGSETKTFTATAVLQLVDQGRVGLDDPISKYISGVPSGDRITIRELADMRSGLFNYSADGGLAKAVLADPRAPFQPEQLLAYAFKHPLMFAPGSAYYYSNTNYVLLGLLVEKLSGQGLSDYLGQHVFAPLHLDHTSLPTDAAFPSPHAQGYTDKVPGVKQTNSTGWNPSWAWAAGAAISTLNDLHTWAPALANGTLLSPATQAERLKVIPLPGAPPVYSELGYGLGLLNVNGWIGHNGDIPGYESLTIYLPSRKATVVVLLNTDTTPLQGGQSTTLIGRAVTQVLTPTNLFDLP